MPLSNIPHVRKHRGDRRACACRFRSERARTEGECTCIGRERGLGATHGGMQEGCFCLLFMHKSIFFAGDNVPRSQERERERDDVATLPKRSFSHDALVTSVIFRKLVRVYSSYFCLYNNWQGHRTDQLFVGNEWKRVDGSL